MVHVIKPICVVVYLLEPYICSYFFIIYPILVLFFFQNPHVFISIFLKVVTWSPDVSFFSMFQCSLSGGGVRCVHSSQECYIIILYFSVFQCSRAGGGARCVHSSQECYIIILYFSVFQCSLTGSAYGGRLSDSSFSATSLYSNNHLPKYGRLNFPQDGWLAKTRNNIPNEHLQIDLGGVYWVCGVATQGEGSWGDEWPTKFKLSLSTNNSTWNIYQKSGSDKVSLNKWI